ncbi:hypothetical protein [Estrella lausannensis]|uniref:Conserved putative membrane protein n=1 Tax=Estrella lausannensis TaxID=483423 RepID=A0A0H5E7Q7_9BACT|nr:hypothetical protein [Estrella lausannensis]CRX39370.1 Conserved putative membrane protein [Estrella lausannensis]
MFKARHKTFHRLAGLIWLAVGFSLLTVGIRYLIDSAKGFAASSWLLGFLGPVAGGREQAACILIAIALFVGYLKVRYVLQKAVHRLSSKILTLPEPAHAKLVFGFRYFALVLAMMGIGLLMKALDLPADIRGFIDVAVGSALISGSMHFFRIARTIPKVPAAKSV